MTEPSESEALVGRLETYIDERARIGDTFRDFYEARGFVSTPEQPPYPSPDKTVLFVGAQTSLWKPLLNKIAAGELPPMVTPQNCVRTQNKDIFFTDNNDMRFCSYFRIQGAITRAEDFSDMVMSAVDFIELIGVDRSRIVIKTASDQQVLCATDAELRVQTEPDSYYSWTYGEDDLSGRGVTLAIKDTQEAELHRDIGNVILISSNGTPVATEWGFGEETLLSAIHGIDPPIHYADLPKELRERLKGQNGYKYADALMTSTMLAKLGVKPGERGEGAVLNEYIQAAAFHGTTTGLDYYGVLKDAASMASHVNFEDSMELMSRLEYYVGRIAYVRRVALNGEAQSDELLRLVKQLNLNKNITDSIRKDM